MIPAGLVLDVRTVSPHFPGIGRVTLGLSQALSRIGHLALLHAAPPDPRLPVPPLDGVPCAAGPFALRQHWEVRRLLRSRGARVYHSPYYLMPCLPGVPSVVTCFDLVPMLEAGTMDRGRRLAYVLAHLLAFRAAAAVCVPSEATASDVARLFPRAAKKLVLVRPGVAWARADAARPAPGAAGCPRSALPPRFALHVGSNKPHKALDVLLEAWALAIRQSPGALARTTLVLAGPRDPRYPEPARSIERLALASRVADLGPVSDRQLEALYEGAALFICPSRREGFGLPLAEAMARGRPCLCSDTPALAETAGGAAALVAAGDAAALSDGIVRLLSDEDEASRLGALGCARAARFDWDAAARDMVRVYERVAVARH